MIGAVCLIESASGSGPVGFLILAHADRFPLKSSDLVFEFLDLHEGIRVDTCEVLVRPAGGPEDVDAYGLCIWPEPDVLFRGVAAKRACLSHSTPDGACNSGAILHRYLNLCSDSRSIGFDSHQAHIDPVVAVSGILKEANNVLLGGDGTAVLADDVFLPVAPQISKGNAVAFMQFAGTGRRGDVDELFSIVIPE